MRETLIWVEQAIVQARQSSKDIAMLQWRLIARAAGAISAKFFSY